MREKVKKKDWFGLKRKMPSQIAFRRTRKKTAGKLASGANSGERGKKERKKASCCGSVGGGTYHSKKGAYKTRRE